ncbi:MAG TPA: SPOR domain-containing protein [Desulfosalsimonadaceae bacterium]|nr:SPOR domain-containing protein [Desulfosalsimonadaceae bacterium]
MAATSAQKKRAPRKTSGPLPILVIHRRNLAGWLLVFVCCCGLMFVCGVLVGRNTMPLRFDMDSLDAKLANLQRSVLTTGKVEPIDVMENLKKNGLPEVRQQRTHTLAPKTGKPEHIEKAQAPKTDAEKTPRQSGKPARARAESRISAQNSGPSAAGQESAEAGAGRQTPVKTPHQPGPSAQNSDKDAAAGAPAKRSGYVIQVASLKNPESAGKVRKRFLAKGYPAYCRTAEVNGITYHRVRIGPYPSREKAREDRSNLADAGVDAMVFLIDGSD